MVYYPSIIRAKYEKSRFSQLICLEVFSQRIKKKVYPCKSHHVPGSRLKDRGYEAHYGLACRCICIRRNKQCCSEVLYLVPRPAGNVPLGLCHKSIILDILTCVCIRVPCKQHVFGIKRCRILHVDQYLLILRHFRNSVSRVFYLCKYLCHICICRHLL